MFRFLIFSCLFVLIGSDKPYQNWSESYQLQWSDFQGKPMSNTKTVAVTASGIAFEFSMSTSSNQPYPIYKFNVESQFYPEESWYVEERVNSNVLNHERLHFDITELHARKLRRDLKGAEFSGASRAKINDIYTEILRELASMQNQYDSETNHSINIDKQKEWQIFVKSEMQKLKNYSS